MARIKKEQGASKDTPLQIDASVKAMESPEMVKISYHATAGLSEQELIKKNTIATIEAKDLQQE